MTANRSDHCRTTLEQQGVCVSSASFYQHKTHLSVNKYGKFHPMAPCYMCSCSLGSFTTQLWYRPRCTQNPSSSWDTTRREELRKTNWYWSVIDLNKLHSCDPVSTQSVVIDDHSNSTKKKHFFHLDLLLQTIFTYRIFFFLMFQRNFWWQTAI